MQSSNCCPASEARRRTRSTPCPSTVLAPTRGGSYCRGTSLTAAETLRLALDPAYLSLLQDLISPPARLPSAKCHQFRGEGKVRGSRTTGAFRGLAGARPWRSRARCPPTRRDTWSAWHSQGGGWGEVPDLAVAPERRGQAIGSRRKRVPDVGSEAGEGQAGDSLVDGYRPRPRRALPRPDAAWSPCGWAEDIPGGQRPHRRQG